MRIDVHSGIVYLEQMSYIRATLIEPYEYSSRICTGKSIAAHERQLCCLGQSSPYIPDDFHIEHILPDNVVDDYTFSQEFIGGINHFIENNLILRQCPVCKGYFKTKTTSDTTFCNRQYKGNLTCQNVGAHINYKAKIKQDVIYSEYRKFYYKLHSQIRRGTRDKDSAHFEELKKLQEIYNYKYANTPDDQKRVY